MISMIQSQEDISSVIRIFNLVWGAETVSELLINIQTNICLLARNDCDVVGYLFYEKDDRDFIEITDIGIDPDYRKMGYGKELIFYLFDSKLIPVFAPQYERIRLCVKEDNVAAIKLYNSLGFKALHTIQNYYGVGKGNDAIRMEWVRSSFNHKKG